MMYVLCFKKEQARKHQEREKKRGKNVPKNKFDIWFTIKHFK